MQEIITGLTEFIEENAKGMITEYPWMKERELRLCHDIDELRAFIDGAIASSRCALDLETTGLNTRTKNGQPIDKIVGFALSFNSKKGLYVPVRHQEDADLNLPEDGVLQEIRRLCANCVTIYQNAKFDLAMLRNYGILVTEHTKIEDTMILARLYDAGQKNNNLKELSKRLLNQPMIEFEQICGSAKRFDLISPKIGYIYAACDAVCELDLFNFFMNQPIIQKQMGIYLIEKRTLFVVLKMEQNLIKIDVPYLLEFKAKIEARIEEIKREIYRLVGQEFNIGSPKQLGKILFQDLGYRYPEKEQLKSGQWSTADKTLEKIKNEYPVVAKITEYRELEKVLGTYITNLLANHDEDNCVKLSFNQTGTETGRFSSPGGEGINIDGYAGINIQSIPKPKKDGNKNEETVNMRKAFIARPGFKIIAMDYSNEEMRVAANLSKEPLWIQAFLDGADLHEKSGQIIFGKQNITEKERGIGKTCNFAILYGGGPKRISEVAGCSLNEAKKIQAAFFAGVPTLKKWIESEIRKARRSKAVMTAFGRIRPLNSYYDSDDISLQSHGDRCVVNTEIQGSCSDIMKSAMIRIHNWILSNGYQDCLRILITMHDELVFECKEDMLDFFIPRLNKIMLLSDILQGMLKWPVPLTVDAEYGNSWYAEHNYFKEHPEAKNIPEKGASEIEFHSPQQVTGRFAIAVKGIEPKTETESAKSAEPEEPVDEQPTEIPQVSKPSEESNEFVYTLKDRSESTARVYNMIINFLAREEKAKIEYKCPKKKLILKDPDGNSLLVSDIFVNTDLFTGLARFMGI